jgi:glycosyltransferase involved in cell wall biosynthesis
MSEVGATLDARVERLRVSVVAPVRNEEHTLAALLDSLLGQTAAPDEIVLADGGSTDGTVALARRYAGQGVRLLEIGPAYPGRGRNAGIQAARNDWVALIDGGCEAEPGWLENLIASRELLGPESGVIFGECRPRLVDEWDIAQALACIGPPDPLTGVHPRVVPSSLLHRAAWRRVGGFPENLRAAEDLLFIKRLDESRIPTTRSPKAVIRWRLAAGPRGVWRRFRLYSAHHLAAGLYETWHLRVMAMDLVALGLLGATAVWSITIPLLGLTVLARLLLTVARRRNNVPHRQAFRPDRLLRVALLLLLADAAMWMGALDRVVGREPPR